MTWLGALLLLAGCDARAKTEPGEDACQRYAIQFEALKQIEAQQTMETLGGAVRPEDLVVSPTNIARAVREVEPRCNALSEKQRACVEAAMPIVDVFLDERAACDDRPCRSAAGEAAEAKFKVTDDCMEVIRDLDCLHTQDCKEL